MVLGRLDAFGLGQQVLFLVLAFSEFESLALMELDSVPAAVVGSDPGCGSTAIMS